MALEDGGCGSTESVARGMIIEDVVREGEAGRRCRQRFGS